MSKIHTQWILGLLCAGLMSLVLFVFSPYSPLVSTDEPSVESSEHREESARIKPARQTAKGIYLTASSAGNPKKTNEIIALIGETELNAVVIDIKDYTGHVLYDSTIPLVQELSLDRNVIGDVGALIRQLHDENIYVIARQTVFQDPILAEKKSEWAIHSTEGGLWRDNKGLAWVDPTNRSVWEYNTAIAKEAIEFGFDEINFDYVRFPSDGNMKTIRYTNEERSKNESMADFFSFLHEEFLNEPAWISLDFFGFVMERDDGLSIGQRLVDAIDRVDYISPMMYPSHYPSGHLGLSNPASSPGIVIDHGMAKGAPFFASSTRTAVRPWLQAFHLGAVYDGTKIRQQIEAVERYPNAGWLLWNAANRYSASGLQLDTTSSMW